jgi:hypothetical protein
VVTAALGDYNTDQITEGQSLYFSASRARKVLSVTTFNTSGPATYDSTTGIINIPQYGSGESSPANFVPLTRKISINGQTADLSVDRMFSVEEMVYPPLGIPVSNGTSWAASITNNSANWNTAYSWGNHALAGYLTSFTETDPIWTAEKVNYYTKIQADARYLQSYTETDPVWTAEKINYYTKTQSDGRYLQSFTETDPIWTSEKTNYALKTYVDTSISNLIDTAPTTLNTLNELAAALGDDANFSTTITTLIGTKEPAITPGTTAQYWRGDKTWQTLPIYTLSGLGGEPAISPGTTSQYWRGDKTWQTLPIYSLPIATASILGGIKVGSNLSINPTTGVLDATFTYTLPTASATVLGGIKVGSNLSIDGNGVLSAGNSYVLPIASASVLGGIKVGTNLSIDANGVLSSTDTNTTYANFTRTVSGLVPNPGGSTTNRYLREDGTWVIPPDTDTNTWVANSVNVAGYVAAPGAVANKVWKTDGSGNPAWRDDADTDTVYVHPTTAGNKHIPAGGTTGQILRWSADGTAVWGADNDTTYTLAGLGGLALSGGVMTGAITLKEGVGNGLKFPNDVFGGSGDTAGMRLVARSGEAMSLEVYLTNDADDWFNISVPDNNAAKVNGNTIWNTANLTNLNQLSNGPGYITSYVNTWDANTRDVAGYVAAPGAVANKVWKTDASGNPAWRDDADTDTNTTYTAGAGLTLSGTSFSVTKTITASETADTIALRNGSGQLVATGFFQASSRTLKTNISPFTRSALDIIREVSVVSFNYKTDVINKHIGFIAEDTPEELSTRSKNVMDSNNTIGVLLKAIQELEDRIKTLESK